MPQRMMLWQAQTDGTCRPYRANAPVALEGNTLTAWDERISIAPVCFVPDDHGGALGALLLPAAVSQTVTLSGVRLHEGMHTLHHADHLQIGDVVLWVSSESTPEQTTYDPQLHGADVFCARTKTRLKAGEPIVVCPGTPVASCRLIYKASAWTPQIVCPQCKFDPTQPPWQPPRIPALEPSHDLLDRIRRKPR